MSARRKQIRDRRRQTLPKVADTPTDKCQMPGCNNQAGGQFCIPCTLSYRPLSKEQDGTIARGKGISSL